MKIEVLSSAPINGLQALHYFVPQQLDHCDAVVVYLDSSSYSDHIFNNSLASASDLTRVFSKWYEEMLHAANGGSWILVSVQENCATRRDQHGHQVSLLDWFVTKVQVSNTFGQKIIWTDDKFQEFFERAQWFLVGFYHQFDLGPDWIKLGVTSKGYCVSALRQIGTGGILLLPAVMLPARDEREYEALISELVDLAKEVKKSSFGHEPTPGWVSDVRLKSQRQLTLESEVASLDLQLDKLQQRKVDLSMELSALDECEVFLFGTGKRLERAVHSFLVSLGFTPREVNSGVEVDFCGSDAGGRTIVVEVSAKDSAEVDARKFNQLGTERAAAISEIDGLNVQNTFAVLVGNGYRLTPVGQRNSHFTKHVKEQAEKFEVILIESPSLYTVAVYLIDFPDNEEFKLACRDAIVRSKGNVVQFPDPPVPPLQAIESDPTGETPAGAFPDSEKSGRE